MRQLLPALLLLGACRAGEVDVDEVEDFGRVRSALWYELKSVHDDNSTTAHSLILSSRGGLCRRMQSAYEEANAINRDYYEDYVEADTPKDACYVARDYLTELAGAFDGVSGDGANTLTLSAEDPRHAPGEGEYELNHDAYGTLSYVEGNSYDNWLGEIDCDEADWSEALYRNIDGQTYYTLSDGTMTVTKADDKRIDAEVDAKLETYDGDRAGSLTAHGRFEYCRVELDGEMLL